MGTHILPRNLEHSASPLEARVFMFPGQSSVAPDAIARALRAHGAAAQVAGRARAVLGARAAAYLDGPAVTLAGNRDVQITVFLATQMYLAALHAEGIEAACSLGLSLGEYSHLVHIGALEFEDALELVDERGRCYDAAPQGVMATVLAVPHDVVASVVSRAALEQGPIVISNINAPTQHVIAGTDAAVAWAAATLEDEHAAHVTIIERRVPMHSPLMAPVAEAFAPALARAPWQRPSLPYLPNVTATPIDRATPRDFVTLLTRHVGEPVRWQAAVERLIASHGEAAFVEVGPGGVLHNMFGRAWRGARRARVDAPEGIEPRAHLAATVEALRA